jgi:hypothetical protein
MMMNDDELEKGHVSMHEETDYPLKRLMRKIKGENRRKVSSTVGFRQGLAWIGEPATVEKRVECSCTLLQDLTTQ